MSNSSILFKNQNRQKSFISAEAYEDIHTINIIDIILKNKERYNIRDYFLNPISDIDTILYRQSISQDLEIDDFFTEIKNFSEKMIIMHRYYEFSKKLSYTLLKKSWFLESILLYCNIIENLVKTFNKYQIKSEGFLSFNRYITDYITKEEFTRMHELVENTKSEFKKIKYCLIVETGKISVKTYEDEDDYSKYIQNTFSRFYNEDIDEQYKLDFTIPTGTTHIDAKILEFLEKIFPKPFLMLDELYQKYKHFMDNGILNFENEIQFYLSYIEFMKSIESKGLNFCYPVVSVNEKQEEVVEGYDLFLACISEDKVITNNYIINNNERVIVVTGPNQGGKTSFARMFGQIHYLAILGLKVPAKSAKIFIANKIFTHFDKIEDVKNLKSKLEDDLIRAHKIVENLDNRSLVIFNEIFSSTSLSDALEISKKIMSAILEKDCMAVWVTFIDDLSRLDNRIISMVAEVSPEDPSIRTFKVLRKKADGKAYAMAIAEKYNLTNKKINERIKK